MYILLLNPNCLSSIIPLSQSNRAVFRAPVGVVHLPIIRMLLVGGYWSSDYLTITRNMQL